MVSVIIPNYNHSAFLRERIDSVLRQTYEDFEVILLDDCSSDNSREVMESYRDNSKVTHIIFNEKNSGSTFLQWEKGFRLAKGEFIWIAESDDVADEHLLSECMTRLENDADIQLAFTYSHMIDQDGKELKMRYDHPSHYRGNGIYDACKFRQQRMVYTNAVYNASMVVFRKEALSHIDGKFKEFRYCGDWVFWFEMMAVGKVAEIPQKLNYFRQHMNKVSTRATGNGLNFLEGAMVNMWMAEKLGLSSYQSRCLRGRMSKRIRKANFEGKESLIRQYPQIYGGSAFDIAVYEIDKYLHLSGFMA